MLKHLAFGLVLLALAAEAEAEEDGYCEGMNAGMSCCADGSGTLLPVFPMEHTWNRSFRAFLYLLGLLWCFLGVSVLSDVFMSGIETITQTTVTKTVPKKDENGNPVNDQNGNPILLTEEHLVWNPAVANLSLMALGSSTPEILLSIIEIGTGGFLAEDLGPSTIVGSAAFNLYVITSFCMVALPVGEGRKIEGVQTFLLTASCSVICYLWLYFIVLVSTPDIVDIWEALVTLLAMPVLIWLVWMADNNWFREEQVHPSEKAGGTTESEGGRETPSPPGNGVSAGHNAPLAVAGAETHAEHHKMTAAERNKKFFEHRHGARGFLMGGNVTGGHLHEDEETKQAREMANAEKTCSVFQFENMQYSFMETVGTALVKVLRQGRTDLHASVQVSTVDGTAHAGKAYTQQETVLEFQPGETEKDFAIPILHDDVWNDDQEFFVQLTLVETKHSKLGKMAKTCCTIIDMDSPGVFCWLHDDPQYFLSSDSRALLVLERRKGCKGTVSVRIATEGHNAKEGEHYKPVNQVLYWKDNESAKTITVNLKQFPTRPEGEEGHVVKFSVKLYKGESDDGSSIGNGVQEVLVTYHDPIDTDDLQGDSWADQFRSALNVSGGDNMEESGMTELTLHYLSITWKLIGALVPPAHYGGGWYCFWIALLIVGMVTALIKDLASIFGCLVGLKDPVTAMTIVALGTSLPDTFASVLAIQSDDNADNAIGNVTGSNSVNVFLGLGLPWTAAAIYWEVMGPTQAWHDKYSGGQWARYEQHKESGGFVVIGGSLGFNTLLFSILTLVAFLAFFLRRKFIGYEIGGPKATSWATSFLFFGLWVIYILVASLQVYHFPEVTLSP